MPQWTEEQRAAIEARDSSILLSAAAGSGKTTVLVERVLRLIAEEGAAVDRMLVVTFTRAAASDMRSKLARRLNERAAMGDALCREQSMRLDRASITTLHAFCADCLRTNFEAAKVDPAFRVLDDAIVSRLRDEALDEALELAYAGDPDDEDGPSPDLRLSPDMLALDYGRGPSGVRAAVGVLLTKLEERPDPEAWLDRAVRCDEAALQAWQDELKDSARRSIDLATVQLRQAIGMAGCPPHYEKAMRTDLEVLAALSACEDYDELHRGLSEFKPTPARGRLAGADPEVVESVKHLRDASKKAVNDARIIQLPLMTAREDAVKLSSQLRTLAGIALKARALFDGKKAEQSGLSYADLEHKTLAALRDPAVAQLLRERYDHIFVDEYQDTSDLQEAIISAIARPNNRFMVGDVKQSIYRFRLAEPRLFLEKYRAYGAGDGGRLLPLTRNFRSRPGILAFVNQVFERAMTGDDSEIEYDELARLNPGLEADGDHDGPDVNICLIDRDAVTEDAGEIDESILEMKSAEQEGALIVKIIRRAMAEDPTLRYRDFAILSRSRSGAFTAMLPLLLAAGIPAYAEGAAGYYDSMEIAWTLSMLRLIANRRLDVELIGMLRGPAAGLSAEDLAQIRIAFPEVPFCDAAASYAESETDGLAARLRDFFALMDGWRLRQTAMGLGEFLRLVLDESGFYTFAGALPGGAQRQANLDQLVASASDFDRTNSGTLTRFLQFTEHLKAKGDGDAAHLLSENDDVVRLMTVHKSKGLEFRVVIGAQLAKKYRVEKTSAPLVTHRDLGMGIQYIDPELRTKRLTLPQAAIIERGRREDAAEELRILYVMLTRAKDRLFLTGSVRNAEAAVKRWQALAETPFAASSHLDVVMASLNGRTDCAGVHWFRPDQLSLQDIAPDAEAGDALTRVLAEPERYSNAALNAELTWTYPDPEGAKRPLKLTASGLIRELEGPEAMPDLTERPQFMLEDGQPMTGAERGTAYHRAMQLLDLRDIDGLSGNALVDAVAGQLDRAVALRLMTRPQRDAVKPEALSRFLESPMGLRLRQATTLRREWPFNVRLQATDALTPEERDKLDDAELLVQGTIDCCFVEDGQWVLLDYKTDRTGDMDALRAHYQSQLRLYALALQRITHMPVKQRTLCLISQNKTLDV